VCRVGGCRVEGCGCRVEGVGLRPRAALFVLLVFLGLRPRAAGCCCAPSHAKRLLSLQRCLCSYSSLHTCSHKCSHAVCLWWGVPFERRASARLSERAAPLSARGAGRRQTVKLFSSNNSILILLCRELRCTCDKHGTYLAGAQASHIETLKAAGSTAQALRLSAGSSDAHDAASTPACAAPPPPPRPSPSPPPCTSPPGYPRDMER